MQSIGLEEYQCVKCGYVVKGTLNVVNEARREHERETCPSRGGIPISTNPFPPIDDWKTTDARPGPVWVTSTLPVP